MRRAQSLVHVGVLQDLSCHRRLLLLDRHRRCSSRRFQRCHQGPLRVQMPEQSDPVPQDFRRRCYLHRYYQHRYAELRRMCPEMSSEGSLQWWLLYLPHRHLWQSLHGLPVFIEQLWLMWQRLCQRLLLQRTVLRSSCRHMHHCQRLQQWRLRKRRRWLDLRHVDWRRIRPCCRRHSQPADRLQIPTSQEAHENLRDRSGDVPRSGVRPDLPMASHLRRR